MPVTLREFEEWLTDRQPLGRDAKIEALTLQTNENTKATLWLRKEVLHMRRALDVLRGSDVGSR